MRTSPHPRRRGATGTPRGPAREPAREPARGPSAPSTGPHPGRAAALVVGGLTAAALGPLLLDGALTRGAELVRRPGTGVDDLVLVLAAAAAGVLLLWLVATGAASAAALLLRRRGVRWAALDALERRVVPGLVRRAVAAGLGASVVVGLAAPAALAASTPPVLVEVSAAAGPVPVWPAEAPASTGTAQTAAEPTPAAPTSTGPTSTVPTSGGPTSGGPTRPAQPAPAPAGASSRVVVTAGDSLWELAAQELGPGSGDAAVAQEWPRWWAANRAVIGDDPDLLQPGQVLQAPGTGR